MYIYIHTYTHIHIYMYTSSLSGLGKSRATELLGFLWAFHNISKASTRLKSLLRELFIAFQKPASWAFKSP